MITLITGSFLFVAVAVLAVAALRRAGAVSLVEPDDARAAPQDVEEWTPRWQELTREEVEGFVERERPRILDVRSPGETSWGVVPGAVLIPVDELPTRLNELPRDDRPTIVVCAHGIRSAYACDFLDRSDFEGVYNLAGGIVSWPNALERPRIPG